ncbi:MAG: MerR family DNA-binding transcriptional regulator [Gammaproteobacteria bacterium]|jgi:DNA-binding transcriptional MerR regulator|nr:MerR family DNA-binding transcriptional regulator [Gammaproteobacteria bacterium]MBT4493406.1 MerR family DNA-binding transcriptional regulator [Gammaproteobacteria bacterium]MBT7369931.1 MerR family DNA-binding transcriptional regulator [Gammaproteobacteria bacterium]
MKDEQYSIRDLSREFEVTPRTLRFYEEKGLLCPARNGQNRIYSAADRTRLLLILRGKRLGFSLGESADLIRMYDPSSSNENQLQALIDKIREKRDRLQQQKQELELMITDLGDWETRSLESLEELQKNGDLT